MKNVHINHIKCPHQHHLSLPVWQTTFGIWRRATAARVPLVSNDHPKYQMSVEHLAMILLTTCIHCCPPARKHMSLAVADAWWFLSADNSYAPSSFARCKDNQWKNQFYKTRLLNNIQCWVMMYTINSHARWLLTLLHQDSRKPCMQDWHLISYGVHYIFGLNICRLSLLSDSAIDSSQQVLPLCLQRLTCLIRLFFPSGILHSPCKVMV